MTVVEIEIPPIRKDYQEACYEARAAYLVAVAKITKIDEAIRHLSASYTRSVTLKTDHAIEIWDEIIATRRVDPSTFPRSDVDERTAVMYGAALLRAKSLRPGIVLEASESQLLVLKALQKLFDGFADDVDTCELADLAPHIALYGTTVFPRDLPSRPVRDFSMKLTQSIDILQRQIKKARDKGGFPTETDVEFFNADAIAEFDQSLVSRSSNATS